MPSYIPELFNTDPYYDDFNEDKKFLRIMFRPGYGVQARELTQLQTIIQNQIERFGSNIFQEGSMVLDGKITVNSLKYARVSGLSGTSDVTDFIGTVISCNNRATAKVVHAEVGYTNSSVDNIPVIFYEYLEGGTAFAWGDRLAATASNGSPITIGVTGATGGLNPASSGNALVVSVDKGVRFAEGFFVLHDAQSIGSYSLTGTTGSEIRLYDNPTSRMGLNVVKSFVQSEDDSTLNDPAYGSYNYNAPGADRFKIDLVLGQKSFFPSNTSSTDNFSRKDFIEFLRLVSGSPVKIEKYPDYASLEDTLARRTYDESGNYTVRPFELNIKEGPGITSGGATGNLYADLEPGKAYIFGHEFETQSITRLPIDAARDTSHVRTINDKYFNRSLGPYAYVTFSGITGSMTGFNNFDDQQTVYLANGASGSVWTQLGTARLRWIAPYSSDVYSLHMYNVQMAGTASFNDVTRIFVSATGPTHAFSVTGNSGLVNLQNGNLLYEFPTGTRGKTVTDASYAIAGFFDVTLGAGNFPSVGTNKSSRGTINVTDYTSSATDVAFSIAPSVNVDLPNADIMAFNRQGVPIGGTAYKTSSQQLDITLSGAGVTSGEKVFIVASIDVTAINSPDLRRDKSVVTEEISYTAGGFTGVFGNLTGDSYGNTVLYLGGKVDVIEVLSITGTKDTAVQLKQYFTFDNGQRDNLYDWSRLVLTPGVTGITGPYQATVRRYTRSGNRGPFTIDSYPLPYSSIPLYTSKTTGKAYDLADVIDFRPDRGSSGDVVGYPWFPINTAANDQLFSYQHYLPRTDKIVLTRDKNFSVIKGIPSLDAQMPPDDPNAMSMYTVTVNPYTFDKGDVSVRFIENKRYTMRDIGDLEKRIEAVEYYTTLTLLEQEAKSLSIVDANNIEVPKKGILVDQFKGHNIGDVANPMYAASIDFENNELRPPFVSKVFGLSGPVTSSAISLTASTDGIVTLPYTTSADIAQPLATKTIVVNPSCVFNYLGSLSLSPAGDFWFDTGMTPSVKVNISGENDAWESGVGFGTQWNDWESIWYGRETTSETNTKQNSPTKNSIVAGTKGLSLGNTFKSGVPEGIKRKSVSKVIRKDVVPFMRDQTITMNATGLKPNTKFYVFVDDIDITAYCTGGSQITSSKGEVTDLKYIMSQDTVHNFLTGRRVFRITDSSTNTPSEASMAADALYNASGSVDPLGEDGILSTRPADVRRRTVKNNKVQSNLIDVLSTDFFGFTEPLSQTFYVDPVVYPDGVYVKKVGIAFSAVDSNANTPITLMLKPTQSGYPHPSKVMPFGQKTIYSSDITTSTDGSTESLFTFSSPIYLLPGGEYSVSLYTNSSSFSVYGSSIGEDIIRLSESETTRKATKQPSIRSLFLPQNTGTLEKKDTDSLKFSLHLCKFSPQTGSISYETDPGSYSTGITFDALRLNMNTITPSNTTAAFTENGLLNSSSSVSIQPNKTIDRPSTQSTRSYAAGSKISYFTVTMNGTPYASPSLDLQTSHYLVVGNTVNNNTVLATNRELFPTNYGATAASAARYITKQVTLEPGFEATNVYVQMSLCNTYDSSVQVFVRPLPVGESDFGSIGYTQLIASDSNYSQNSKDFREVYFTSNGLTPALGKFRAFAVKVVMYASDPLSPPRIKNLRMIAT